MTGRHTWWWSRRYISFVFLTELFAYKLKKPVRFDFLDFSTPERRRKACEDEVRFNRRLARNVYLGVLPITRCNGQLSLNGDGTPVDWVVKMSRLPANRTLDVLAQSAKLSTQEVAHVGRRLTQFFTHLPPLTISPHEYRRRLEQQVRQNRDSLLEVTNGMDHAAVRRVHEIQLLMLKIAPEVFDYLRSTEELSRGMAICGPSTFTWRHHPQLSIASNLAASFVNSTPWTNCASCPWSVIDSMLVGLATP